jgi:hypothetical protein
VRVEWSAAATGVCDHAGGIAEDALKWISLSRTPGIERRLLSKFFEGTSVTFQLLTSDSHTVTKRKDVQAVGLRLVDFLRPRFFFVVAAILYSLTT